MRFHSQNLNEKKYKIGSIWRHGRCWIGGCYSKATQLRIEWSFFSAHSISIELALADYEDDAIGGHLTLGYLGGLYFGFANPWLRRILDRITSREEKPRELDQCSVCLRGLKQCCSDVSANHLFQPRTYWLTNGRDIGLTWFEGNLWINLWDDPMERCRKDPWWWHISLNPVDIIFGRRKYEERTLEETRVIAPMPEHGYPASVRIHEATWRRSRWPWPKRMIRADIKPDTPIPFPGKGESSWDCGEDSTHSMTCAADTPLKAAMALSESVMHRRLRYGAGWNYRPEKVVA